MPSALPGVSHFVLCKDTGKQGHMSRTQGTKGLNPFQRHLDREKGLTGGNKDLKFLRIIL